MATANIIVAAGSTLPTPPVGEATLFVDTENNNILSLKLSDGSVRVYSESGAAECCSCELAKKFMDQIGCALNSGMLPPDTYQALINSGYTVNTSETDDGNGNKTCTVTIGTTQTTPTGIAITDPGNVSIAAGAIILEKIMTPLGANPGVVWTSQDPTKGTVNPSTGEFTPIAIGDTLVTAYSIVNPSVSGTRIEISTENKKNIEAHSIEINTLKTKSDLNDYKWNIYENQIRDFVKPEEIDYSKLKRR